MTAPVKLWHYRLPSENGEGWAEIVLGSNGFFAAVSDWGNYAFAWRAAGDNFREFIADTSRDLNYVAQKLAGGVAGKEHQRAKRFCEKVLPRLADAIRAELAAEAA